MSTPKRNERNGSLLMRREGSARSVLAREGSNRDFDEVIMRKRFKIKPYSSFEDKFIEQDKINRYTWELLSKLEEKLKENTGNTEEFEKINSVCNDLERRVREIGLDLIRKEALFTEIIGIKEFLTDKVSSDKDFKGKSNEKTKVLFEEVHRLGQITEKCERSVQELRKSMGKYKHKTFTMASIPEIEGKIHELQENISKISQSLNYDQRDLTAVMTRTELMKKDFEIYIFDLKNSFKNQLTTIADEMVRRLESEVNDRIKDNKEFKYALDITSKKIYEQFSAHIQSGQEDLKQLKILIDSNSANTQESFKNVSINLEASFASVGQRLDDESKQRKLLEFRFSQKYKEIQSEFAKSCSDFKSEQDIMLQRFKETINCEIDTRAQAERELKSMIEVTSKDMIFELHNCQMDIEKLFNDLTNTETDLRQSISEKADLVSRFAESEINTLQVLMWKQKENTTQCIADLTESMKKNILNNEKWKASNQEAQEKISKAIDEIKNDSLDITNKNRSIVLQKIKKLQISFEKKTASNYQILENRIDKLHSNIQKCLNDLSSNSEENKEIFTSIVSKLDEKIVKIDTDYHKELGEVIESLGHFDEDLKFLIESEGNYGEIIAQLETQIDLKVVSEKLSREHMVNFFQQEIFTHLESIQNKQKISKKTIDTLKISHDEIISKVKETDENYKELSKALDAFRENIQAEVRDYLEDIKEKNKIITQSLDSFRENIKIEVQSYLEDITGIKEKIELGEMVLENLKDKISELEESNTRLLLISKNNLKLNGELYLKESYDVVQDLTSRVETMDILKQLNMIFQELDSNEKETQAMLQLYKKELQYIQERQQKGLEQAQNVVYEVFDKKISDLQELLVEEMNASIRLVRENNYPNINLSGLQEISKRFNRK